MQDEGGEHLERGIPRDTRAAELGAWREPTWGWHRAPSSSPCLRQAPNPAVPKDNRDVVLPTAPMPAAWISLREIHVLNAVGVCLFGPGGWQVELVGRRMRVLALV